MKIYYVINPNITTFNRAEEIIYIDPYKMKYHKLEIYFFVELCKICIKENL